MGPKKKPESIAESFEQAVKGQQKANYVLRLYVAGNSARSQAAIMNIRKVCEEYLKGHYQLEVVDIYQRPELASGEQIIAAPTLIKSLPLPLRRVIGDLTRTERILVGLDLIEAGGAGG